MGLQPGAPMICTSTRCSLAVATNSRIEDTGSRAIVKKIGQKSQKRQAGDGGARLRSGQSPPSKKVDVIFKAAGFEWREPGCPCLAMNADRLSLAERCSFRPTETLKAGKARAAERTWSARPWQLRQPYGHCRRTTICLNRKNDPHEKFQFMFLAASLGWPVCAFVWL
jgi:3-isopropylmalate/(R)-2-methylmalate dehydratase large subunit